jgi:hypothetical protein
VFEAWTDAELVRQWWVPKSLGLSVPSGMLPTAATRRADAMEQSWRSRGGGGTLA